MQVMHWFHQLFAQLFSEACYAVMFQQGDLLNAQCVKQVITKCLGYGIIVGSVIVKLPQIVKILSSGSSAGLSFSANLLELIAISATAAYGWRRSFPFSAYGEGMFLALQTAGIAFFTLLYQGKARGASLFACVYALCIGYAMSPAAPYPLLQALQTAGVPLTASGKLLQAWHNFRAGSTGQLSLITVTLLFLGAIARVFTSVQETGDSLLIIMYAVSTACNGLLLAQIFLYWPRQPQRSKAE